MKLLAMFTALLLGTAARAADETPFELGGDATKGSDYYKMLCIQCHGEKGRGDGPAATSVALDPKPANFTDPKNLARLTPEYVYQVIRDGGPSHGKSALMVSWRDNLSDEQLRNVAAYVLRFKPAAKSKPVAPKKEKK